MSISSNTGTKVYISATKPATFTAAAYAALTWSEIGEITNIGDIGGEWPKVEHKAVAGYVIKRKGILDPGSTTLEAACDTDDAGQVLAEAAFRSKSPYSFKIAEEESGDVHYFQALVMSFPTKFGGTDSIVGVSMKIEITAEGGVDVVKTLGAG